MKPGENSNKVGALNAFPSELWCCKLKRGVFLAEQLCDVDVNNPPQGSRACSLPAYRTLTPLNAPRPAWQLCCHRVVTCQILMNMQCVLFFCLMHDTPIPPPPPPPPPPVHDALPASPLFPPVPSHTTSPTSPVSPLSPLHWHRCMCCCMACGAAPLPGASPGTGLPHPRTTRALWAQRSSRPAWSAWASISPTMHRYLGAASPLLPGV